MSQQSSNASGGIKVVNFVFLLRPSVLPNFVDESKNLRIDRQHGGNEKYQAHQVAFCLLHRKCESRQREDIKWRWKMRNNESSAGERGRGVTRSVQEVHRVTKRDRGGSNSRSSSRRCVESDARFSELLPLWRRLWKQRRECRSSSPPSRGRGGRIRGALFAALYSTIIPRPFGTCSLCLEGRRYKAGRLASKRRGSVFLRPLSGYPFMKVAEHRRGLRRGSWLEKDNESFLWMTEEIHLNEV